MAEKIIKKILRASVYDIAIETPLDHARFMSARLNNHVLLKREDLQPVFSFKIRGAYNKLCQLTEVQRAKGVIAASAGNHAQGLAISARELKVSATIVMPKTTPDIKVNAVKSFGAKVVLHGDTFDEAFAHSQKLVEEKGLIYIPPYDDEDVIAGQGTVAVEILQQHSGPIHAIFIPVGGGGLIAGMAAYIKYLRPEIKVIGVESEDSACLKAALDAKRRVTLPSVGIFADGTAVAQIGKRPYDIAKTCVDDVITVSSDEICAAMKDIFDDTRSITEPSGALGLAGLKKYVEHTQINNQTLVAIDSGANVNFSRLRYVAERAELGEKREAIIASTIPEQPGSFQKFCNLLGKRSITEFNYRYNDDQQAYVFAGVQIPPGQDEDQKLVEELNDAGYPSLNFIDNDTAKTHIRHMVGGHAPHIENEHVYRFEFPERPGALLKFLTKLGKKWNISMFHYRNHGAAYGEVLVGLQLTSDAKKQFIEFLEDIGYHYWDETHNPAYQLFLGPGLLSLN